MRDVSPVKQVKDCLCYIATRMLLLEVMKANQRGLQRKASSRLVQGNPVRRQC